MPKQPAPARTSSLGLSALSQPEPASVALTRKELIARDRQSRILLAISEAIATIRDKEHLMCVIDQHIFPVFGHKDSGLFVLSADKQYHADWKVEMLSAQANGPSSLNVQLWETIGSRFLHADTAVAHIMQQAGPARYDLHQLRDQGFDHPHFPVMFAAGYRYCLAAPLRIGGEAIGMFCLISYQADTFQDNQVPLLGAVCDLLAVAVANIRANEEILALQQQLEREKTYLLEEVKTTHNFAEIIGASTALQRVFRLVEQVAPTQATVLLLGETGTGKELVARALHDKSPRRGRVLVKVNCAALPPHLVESELFGHEKGAFTGATERRIGKFELADRGTIFLDEIGELPLELQAKLLRVLQEKELERLGGKGTIRADARVIAATHRDLAAEVAAGRFRQDLYYRLHVFPIALPPLRERQEDIPLLTEHFIRKFARKLGRPVPSLRQSALQELLEYAWPGNIRELENLVEQALILHEGGGSLHWGRVLPSVPAGAGPGAIVPPRLASHPTLSDIKQQQQEQEREQLLAALRQVGGRIRGPGGAAALLNLKPTTLEARLVKLGIK